MFGKRRRKRTETVNQFKTRKNAKHPVFFGNNCDEMKTRTKRKERNKGKQLLTNVVTYRQYIISIS